MGKNNSSHSYEVTIGLVKEIDGFMPSSHPSDKKLTVFTNGADHFICETPTGHERFDDRPVLRKATEDERKHHRLVWGIIDNAQPPRPRAMMT